MRLTRAGVQLQYRLFCPAERTEKAKAMAGNRFEVKHPDDVQEADAMPLSILELITEEHAHAGFRPCFFEILFLPTHLTQSMKPLRGNGHQRHLGSGQPVQDVRGRKEQQHRPVQRRLDGVRIDHRPLDQGRGHATGLSVLTGTGGKHACAPPVLIRRGESA